MVRRDLKLSSDLVTELYFLNLVLAGQEGGKAAYPPDMTGDRRRGLLTAPAPAGEGALTTPGGDGEGWRLYSQSRDALPDDQGLDSAP
jgi:hypothetical protein